MSAFLTESCFLLETKTSAMLFLLSVMIHALGMQKRGYLLVFPRGNRSLMKMVLNWLAWAFLQITRFLIRMTLIWLMAMTGKCTQIALKRSCVGIPQDNCYWYSLLGDYMSVVVTAVLLGITIYKERNVLEAYEWIFNPTAEEPSWVDTSSTGDSALFSSSSSSTSSTSTSD